MRRGVCAAALAVLMWSATTQAQPHDAIPDTPAAPTTVEATGEVEGAVVPPVAMVAMELGAMSGRQCLRALTRAGVPFVRVHSGMAGVGTPLHVTGAIRGVTVRSTRARGIREPMDCLLALGLARFASFLRARHVREVRHMSVHRGGEPGDLARHPMLPRHQGGLAIDAAVFVLDDGTEYDVSRDFHGTLGAPVCGPTARVGAQPGARFLRSLFCDAARQGLFHVMLSPNFNDDHHNHFHLEITRSVSWRYVR